ncbi:MAG: hypothetical protein GWO24_31490, partial [Akkermansiaceae bacterium]|nr:hypothetical protein [Akkermansiaceae bacterium]
MLRAGSFLIAVSQRIGLARIGVGPLRALRGLRRLPWRLPRFFGRSWRAAEGRGSTAAVLTGCVMEPWFGEVHQATVEVLQQAGYTVEAPAGQTCCG